MVSECGVLFKPGWPIIDHAKQLGDVLGFIKHLMKMHIHVAPLPHFGALRIIHQQSLNFAKISCGHMCGLFRGKPVQGNPYVWTLQEIGSVCRCPAAPL